MYPGVEIFREAFHVKLIDNRVRLVMQRGDSLPIKHRVWRRQRAQRGFPRVGSFSHGQLAIKLRWENYASRIGIKQNLLRIKAMNGRNRLTRNRVSVITSLADFADRDAAMPDKPRLVPEKIEAARHQWIDQVGRGVEQKRDTFRMLGMHGEVERLFGFNPCRA